MKQTVIGLSGHIDHGKTSLVKALTGKSTERHQEERDRGLTIDIGFAFLNESITLIDVPGHEKFVKNMMAGVSGIDAALIVVAADDGVMPQTIEHFEIIQLLGIKHGVIAINKIDMVDDPDWLDMVEQDIRELISNTMFKDSNIHRVSSITGQGIDSLKEEILSISKILPNRYDRGIFRMPIDRCFNIKGFGASATGTVSSGSVSTNDSIEILPNHKVSKIRGIQTHNTSVNKVSLGDRAAFNLHGIDLNDINRGNQIATEGYFDSYTRLGANIQLLSSCPLTIKQNQRVRIHIGTKEVMANITFIDKNTMSAGDKCPVILKLESPIIAADGDRFIMRLFSPVITIGGGEIIETYLDPKWKNQKEWIKLIYKANNIDRIKFKVSQYPFRPMNQKEIMLRLSLSVENINDYVNKDDSLTWITFKNTKWIITKEQLEDVDKIICKILKKYHDQNPYSGGISKEELRQLTHCEDNFMSYLAEDYMVENNLFKVQNGLFSLKEFSIELSTSEISLQDDIINILEKEGFSSSRYDEIATFLKVPKEKIKLLINLLEKEGKVVRLDESLMFTYNNFKKLTEKVRNFFKDQDLMTVPQFKELAGTTRKYAVPLLEYFDKNKITYRDKEGRKLIK